MGFPAEVRREIAKAASRFQEVFGSSFSKRRRRERVCGNMS